LEHKIEIGDKEYVYNRPIIKLERQVRKLFNEVKAGFDKAPDEDAAIAEMGAKWREAVKIMVKEPDEAILDIENVTAGEVGDVFVSFFVAAATMSEKPKSG
jgi:hypothetical protein